MDELYEQILSKVKSIGNSYTGLKDKSDDYLFSVLVLKNSIYKNPSLSFDESIVRDSIVDGVGDGGVDILLNDPNSEESDMIIGQSKFYTTIGIDEIKDAIHKMIDFYKRINDGDYSGVSQKIQKRFMDVNAEIGDDSKIKFIFYTSAPKNRIRTDLLSKIVKEAFQDDEKYLLEVFFAQDIIDEIKEAESRRPYVEKDHLIIDEADNILWYGEEAAVTNISALSLKELYIRHGINLFSQNLRYFIKKKDIDSDINNTINIDPESFWYKNNGITIVCDDFDPDGRELKLHNFSIVNGGQTTHLIYKNESITKNDDFYLPCKVIKSQGKNADDKSQFNLDIAKATNSQKAIKPVDLKSNSPEQVRFINAMREEGVFYKTKRGEEIPKDYKEDYKHTDLSSVGKLALSGIFQLPATSRNKPSTMYQEAYYNVIFSDIQNQKNIAKISRDMLYIDYFFRKKFIRKFDSEWDGKPFIPFAHNARTICLSYIGLLARMDCGNITDKEFFDITEKTGSDKFYDENVYRKVNNLKQFNGIINLPKYNGNMDKLDDDLYKLFDFFIREGYKAYKTAKDFDPSINESNYLKNDKNYYKILNLYWDSLMANAKESSLFSNINS